MRKARNKGELDEDHILVLHTINTFFTYYMEAMVDRLH